ALDHVDRLEHALADVDEAVLATVLARLDALGARLRRPDPEPDDPAQHLRTASADELLDFISKELGNHG
ncbi:hypothetical protein, partial [Amycolatopsis sp. SID8362]|uniref:hypothetical protein n=1 Tax=Amycolatopsis sp. SID8362 TaxID=2690346 RepID=UPI00136AF81D